MGIIPKDLIDLDKEIDYAKENLPNLYSYFRKIEKENRHLMDRVFILSKFEQKDSSEESDLIYYGLNWMISRDRDDHFSFDVDKKEDLSLVCSQIPNAEWRERAGLLYVASSLRRAIKGFIEKGIEDYDVRSGLMECAEGCFYLWKIAYKSFKKKYWPDW